MPIKECNKCHGFCNLRIDKTSIIIVFKACFVAFFTKQKFLILIHGIKCNALVPYNVNTSLSFKLKQENVDLNTESKFDRREIEK